VKGYLKICSFTSPHLKLKTEIVQLSVQQIFKRSAKSINSKHASFIFPLFSFSFWEPEGLKLDRSVHCRCPDLDKQQHRTRPSLWKSSAFARSVPSTPEGSKGKGTG